MEQKTVIITGGNRGIGLDITKAFVTAGYKVIVGARTDNGFEKQFNGAVDFLSVDVRHESSHQQLVEYALEKTGRLDVYVNNAGFSKWLPISEIDEKQFDEMMAVNLKGAFWGCKAAAAVMKPGTCIINISSMAAKRGSANNSLYCATKFGMNGLTQSLAKELGPAAIRVNALCPVLIMTEGLREALNQPNSPAKGNPDQFVEGFAKAQAALGHLPTGQDVGNSCVFLASEAAAAITGQCINVDCGVFPQ